MLVLTPMKELLARAGRQARRRRDGSPRPLSREAFLSLERWNGTTHRRSKRNGSASGRTRRPSTSRDPEPGTDRSTRATSSRCGRTPPARCTWATSSSTRSATSSRGSGAGTACTCCTRSASTRSGCRPRTRRSARAGTRARSPSRTSRRSRSRCGGMGWAFDWDRLISAHEPTYYSWDQWLFLKLSRRASRTARASPVKWCPVDQVVLANEQVHDGHCEYCGAEVDRRRTSSSGSSGRRRTRTSCSTSSSTLDWPERIKAMQRNWIGRSEGAEIQFRDRGARRRTSPSSRRAPTRCSARPSSCSRRSIRSSSSWSSGRRTRDELRDYVRKAGGEARRGARGRRGEDGRLHRLLRDEPRERGAHPDLGRRLRADGLRHRRDHGGARARRARPRVRRALRPADRRR